MADASDRDDRAAGLTRLRRALLAAGRRVRTARLIAYALAARHRPILAQIVATRRCNLACAYCNEFDAVSAPLPTHLLVGRVDRLAALGTLSIDLSGGEPLLHPDVEQIIGRIRHHGILAGLLTNGYLLTPERIRGLNRAGLDRLQISIDNVTPDDVSRKSLKVLDQKLRLLAAHAEFDVSINSVLGSGVQQPDAALAIAKRALELGFGTSIGLVHDGSGQMVPLEAEQRRIYGRIASLGRGFYSHAHDSRFQRNLIDGVPNEWQCRAGARYLYVCEDGLVHWCSQQRGHPGIPLDRYGAADLEREHGSVKSCAPFCTVSCVYRVALVDSLREKPLETLDGLLVAHRERGGHTPLSVGLLRWMFLTGPPRNLFRKLALRALRTP
ncbi:MAG TPA: radical SAM protein [Vicinamibacterales bacterium]|nr:radical SAM protein [Vicinamibacterales bacterium]